LKKYKSLGCDQILAELIQAGGEKLWSDIHKCINSVKNKKEMSDQWKESVTVEIYKMEDKSDCPNCHGISLLSISYKNLSHFLLKI
jgi:hypothetical protein